MSNEENYKEFDKVLNMTNDEHYRVRYEEALKKSIERRKRLDARTIQIQKRNKMLKKSAIATVVAVAIAISAPIAKKQYMINKAIDYQKQEISMMLKNGQTEFTKDQMLGLMEMFGDIKGIEMVAGENWEDYCKHKGYTTISNVSENGTYATRTPSIKVLKNYLEAEAINRMIENTDSNGNFVFPTIDNNINSENTENTNNGGKLL